MSIILINIGGKERGWKFNNYAFETFMLSVAGKHYTAAAPYGILYAGLVAYCFIKKEAEDFTFEQVCEWADELAEKDPEAVKKIDQIFADSMQFKDLLKQYKDSVEAINTLEEKKSTSTPVLNLQQDGLAGQQKSTGKPRRTNSTPHAKGTGKG